MSLEYLDQKDYFTEFIFIILIHFSGLPFVHQFFYPNFCFFYTNFCPKISFLNFKIWQKNKIFSGYKNLCKKAKFLV